MGALPQHVYRHVHFGAHGLELHIRAHVHVHVHIHALSQHGHRHLQLHIHIEMEALQRVHFFRRHCYLTLKKAAAAQAQKHGSQQYKSKYSFYLSHPVLPFLK